MGRPTRAVVLGCLLALVLVAAVAAADVAVLAAAASGAVVVAIVLSLRRELVPAPRAAAHRSPQRPDNGEAGPKPVPTAQVRATKAQPGPVCQIRWARRSSCFYAVMLDPDGTEHKLARSPRFEWTGSSPPERSPLAEAALAELVNELRNRGWTQMRTKGTDFDEPRWYARRFRWSLHEHDTPQRGAQP